jgi:tetratricopeptide (TPR) repeat protein
VHAALAGVTLLLVLALAAVQLASDAIFSRAADAHSLPARLHAQTGVAIYRRIERIADAPYVDAMLARAALDRGDAAQAQMYAERLPQSTRRDHLLALAAQARGDDVTAQRFFVRAGDIEAITSAVDGLAQRDPARAYDLEYALKRRLEQSGTHPDAVAEAYWRLGTLAWMQSKRPLAMRNYEQAIALSPLSEKYLISAGFSEYELHDYAAAQRYFARVLTVDPASADADAGMGMSAFRLGDRARAQLYAQRARRADPRSHALLSLESLLGER